MGGSLRIPRIGVAFLESLRPRLVHRHASGAAQGEVGGFALAKDMLNKMDEMNSVVKEYAVKG